MSLKSRAVLIAAFCAAVFSAAARAGELGQEIAGQVSPSNYQHYLDDILYTHNGNDRDALSGAQHDLARNNILATFQSFGLQTELQLIWAGWTNSNVIATQVGTLYPDSYFIIGAHYDSASTPGADDNASGVAGVMEIARILSTYRTKYTIKYMAFDMEEYGLYGSQAYLNAHSTDDIRGMISMDMIAHDNGSHTAEISGFASCAPIQNALRNAMIAYSGGLGSTLVTEAYARSDHGPFESAGFQACMLIEGLPDYNPCYHKACDSVDTIGYIHYTFASNMTRSVAGFLADNALVYSHDCNHNGIMDAEEIAADPGLDCNSNGVLDVCEPHGNEDCNNNGVPDLCDIFSGASLDCNHNGIPDDCELQAHDCNSNGIPDDCDIASGVSRDCDRNGVPDECQDTSVDCNNNGIWDGCELDRVLLNQSFENDLPPGWSATGLWHITDQCPRSNTCDPAYWAYFGLDDSCNFNAGAVGGELTAPPVTLSGTSPVVLQYCSAYGGEGGLSPAGFDAAWLTVNGVLADDVSASGQQPSWETRSVDLTAHTGQTVVLAWHFNSRDSTVNEGLGWQIDRVRITAAGGNDCNNNRVPDECDISSGTSSDWNGNGVPDECEDCNANGVADACDVPGGCLIGNCAGAPTCGQSNDCNNNGIPDECGLDDNCPPTGLVWLLAPTPVSTTSITMKAQAYDPTGVQYYFSASGAGAHARDWNAEQAFTDINLQVNRAYSYKFKARDGSPLRNESAYIAAAAVATAIETPTALTFGSFSRTSMQITAPGTFTRLTSNLSGLFFEVTRLDGTPVGGVQANAWVGTQTITASGLTPGKTYRVRVKARNYYGANETPWYPASGYVRQSIPAQTGPINFPNGSDVGGQEQPRR